MLYTLILIVILFRVLFLVLYRTSRNIGYIIPFFLECVFIYPFVIVEYIGLKWNYYGFFTLYLSILSIQMGFLYISNLPRIKTIFILRSKAYLWFIFISILIYAAGVLSNFKGVNVFDFSMANYLAISNSSALDRYSGGQSLSILYRIGSILAYFSVFSLGSILAMDKLKVAGSLRINISLTVFLFLVALLDSFLMAARAGMMMMTFCFISSYFVFSQTQSSGRAIGLSKLTIIKFILSFAGVFLFFLVIQIFRGGKEEFDLIGIVGHLMTWFFGHISVFSLWISDVDITSSLGLGINTFAGLADLMGVKERSSGIYGAINIGDGRESNIYTALRPVIEDWTLFGMAALYFLFGFLISNLIKTKSVVFKKILVFISVAIVLFLMWSFVTSIYVYNTIIFSFVIYIMFISLFVKMRIE